MSETEIIENLAVLYPNAIFVSECKRKPIIFDIRMAQEHFNEKMRSAVTLELFMNAMQIYRGSLGYIDSGVKETNWINLDGQLVEELTSIDKKSFSDKRLEVARYEKRQLTKIITPKMGGNDDKYESIMM
jgi:sRNA-binding protein